MPKFYPAKIATYSAILIGITTEIIFAITKFKNEPTTNYSTLNLLATPIHYFIWSISTIFSAVFFGAKLTNAAINITDHSVNLLRAITQEHITKAKNTAKTYFLLLFSKENITDLIIVAAQLLIIALVSQKLSLFFLSILTLPLSLTFSAVTLLSSVLVQTITQIFPEILQFLISNNRYFAAEIFISAAITEIFLHIKITDHKHAQKPFLQTALTKAAMQKKESIVNRYNKTLPMRITKKTFVDWYNNVKSSVLIESSISLARKIQLNTLTPLYYIIRWYLTPQKSQTAEYIYKIHKKLTTTTSFFSRFAPEKSYKLYADHSLLNAINDLKIKKLLQELIDSNDYEDAEIQDKLLNYLYDLHCNATEKQTQNVTFTAFKENFNSEHKKTAEQKNPLFTEFYRVLSGALSEIKNKFADNQECVNIYGNLNLVIKPLPEGLTSTSYRSATQDLLFNLSFLTDVYNAIKSSSNTKDKHKISVFIALPILSLCYTTLFTTIPLVYLTAAIFGAAFAHIIKMIDSNKKQRQTMLMDAGNIKQHTNIFKSALDIINKQIPGNVSLVILNTLSTTALILLSVKILNNFTTILKMASALLLNNLFFIISIAATAALLWVIESLNLLEENSRSHTKISDILHRNIIATSTRLSINAITSLVEKISFTLQSSITWFFTELKPTYKPNANLNHVFKKTIHLFDNNNAHKLTTVIKEQSKLNFMLIRSINLMDDFLDDSTNKAITIKEIKYQSTSLSTHFLTSADNSILSATYASLDTNNIQDAFTWLQQVCSYLIEKQIPKNLDDHDEHEKNHLTIMLDSIQNISNKNKIKLEISLLNNKKVSEKITQAQQSIHASVESQSSIVALQSTIKEIKGAYEAYAKITQQVVEAIALEAFHANKLHKTKILITLLYATCGFSFYLLNANVLVTYMILLPTFLLANHFIRSISSKLRTTIGINTPRDLLNKAFTTIICKKFNPLEYCSIFVIISLLTSNYLFISTASYTALCLARDHLKSLCSSFTAFCIPAVLAIFSAKTFENEAMDSKFNTKLPELTFLARTLLSRAEDLGAYCQQQLKYMPSVKTDDNIEDNDEMPGLVNEHGVTVHTAL